MELDERTIELIFESGYRCGKDAGYNSSLIMLDLYDEDGERQKSLKSVKFDFLTNNN